MMARQNIALIEADRANLKVIADKVEELKALLQRALDTAHSNAAEEALTDFINELPPLRDINEAIRLGSAG